MRMMMVSVDESLLFVVTGTNHHHVAIQKYVAHGVGVNLDMDAAILKPNPICVAQPLIEFTPPQP